MTIEAVRELALALTEVQEQNHQGRPSFRVRGKIFATLWPDECRVVLKLSLADQMALVSLHPQAFAPVPGTWGTQGWTSVYLDAVEADDFADALALAWKQVAPKRLHK